MCVPFVDPALPAPHAPFWWTERAGGAAFRARARRWRRGQVADLSLARAATVEHIVIDRAGVEHVLLRTADRSATLKLTGARAYRGPVCLAFIIEGRKRAPSHGGLVARYEDLIAGSPQDDRRSLKLTVLRNAVIALDGDTAGASHFEIAAVMFGRTDARQAWKGGSRWMKEIVRRARKKGRELRDGGYRELIR